MRVSELIEQLKQQPQDAVVCVIRDDFPRDVHVVGVELVTDYDDHYHLVFYPEVEDEPTKEAVIIRG